MSDYLKIEPSSRIAEAQKHVSAILYGLDDILYHIQILRGGSFNFVSNDPQFNIYSFESTIQNMKYSANTYTILKDIEVTLDLEMRRRNGGI